MANGQLNRDNQYRKFRFIEVIGKPGFHDVTSGWLETAHELFPDGGKALVEGDYLARLPDGRVFREISFKTEHTAVEAALDQWCRSSGRHWAVLSDDGFDVNDGTRFAIEAITFEDSTRPSRYKNK